MIKILTSRQWWKTTQMLDYINNKGIYVVCKDGNEVHNLWNTILTKNLNIPMPITINEQLAPWNKVFIENFERILVSLNKSDLIFKVDWWKVELNIEETLVKIFNKKWCEVIWYTMTI